MLNNTEKTTKSARNFVKILGINVASTSVSEVLASAKDFISHNHKFYIVTPNPELVLMAQKNIQLRDSLNAADLPIPDGVGLRVAIPGLPIIKGRDLFMKLIGMAKESKRRVFFLGGLNNEAGLAVEKLKMNIDFYQGPRLNQDSEPSTDGDRKLEKEAIDKINAFRPHLLFVAFGNPKQEIWIHKNLSKLNVGGAMAVGGTFRYISGLSPLPPLWMEKLGLEWLFRLFTEPFRLVRVWNAVIVFPLKVWLNKLLQKSA